MNIRLSSVDLLDIQAKALEEGMPYLTLIGLFDGPVSDPNRIRLQLLPGPSSLASRL